MIDFHCHIDLYPDPKAIVDKCAEHGLYVLAVTTTPSAWDGTCRIVQSNSRIRPAIGLHPELVHQRHTELPMLLDLMRTTPYVGEVGIDGSEIHGAARALQQDVFDRILDGCTRCGGRIMSIHSRNAADDVLTALDKHPKAGLPILHWFSGTNRQLHRAIRAGCWFSVGPAMARSEKGQGLIAIMPKDRVLTETDGPFGQHRGAALMPWDVIAVIPTLAKIWNVSSDAATQQLDENFRHLVNRAREFCPN